MDEVNVFAPRYPRGTLIFGAATQVVAFVFSGMVGAKPALIVLMASLFATALVSVMGMRRSCVNGRPVAKPDGLVVGRIRIGAENVRAGWTVADGERLFVLVALRGWYVGMQNALTIIELKSATDAMQILHCLQQGEGSVKRLRRAASLWMVLGYTAFTVSLIVISKAATLPLWALEYVLVWLGLGLAFVPTWLVVRDDAVAIRAWYWRPRIIPYRDIASVSVVGDGESDSSQVALSLKSGGRRLLWRCEMAASELATLIQSKRSAKAPGLHSGQPIAGM